MPVRPGDIKDGRLHGQEGHPGTKNQDDARAAQGLDVRDGCAGHLPGQAIKVILGRAPFWWFHEGRLEKDAGDLDKGTRAAKEMLDGRARILRGRGAGVRHGPRACHPREGVRHERWGDNERDRGMVERIQEMVKGDKKFQDMADVPIERDGMGHHEAPRDRGGRGTNEARVHHGNGKESSWSRTCYYYPMFFGRDPKGRDVSIMDAFLDGFEGPPERAFIGIQDGLADELGDEFLGVLRLPSNERDYKTCKLLPVNFISHRAKINLARRGLRSHESIYMPRHSCFY